MKYCLYSLDFEKAKADILEALTDYTYERIMFYVPVDTGKLMDSFMREVSGDVGRVYTDLYYAKYVEFGTGIRGSSSQYDTNYVSGITYSKSIEGQKAQKFMYKALQDVERDYPEIARSVLIEKGLI